MDLNELIALPGDLEGLQLFTHLIPRVPFRARCSRAESADMYLVALPPEDLPAHIVNNFHEGETEPTPPGIALISNALHGINDSTLLHRYAHLGCSFLYYIPIYPRKSLLESWKLQAVSSVSVARAAFLCPRFCYLKTRRS